MSDKLQEIKHNNQDSVKMISKEPNFYLPNELMLIDHNTWLIEQLEQAQQENEMNKSAQEEYRNIALKAIEEGERLHEQNQKLVECLEWYTNCGYDAYDEDCGDRAAQTLSEVKGNG